jgi:hypothetical protein
MAGVDSERQEGTVMRAAVAVAIAVSSIAVLAAQETKPVPKDSMRVYLTGCTKGRVFTAGPRMEDPPSNAEIREGTHLRMNGPKKVMEEIKAQEGSMMVGITGLVKKGQYAPGGVSLGGGVRIAPAPSPSGPSASIGGAGIEQAAIDVESVRPVAGRCPSK